MCTTIGVLIFQPRHLLPAITGQRSGTKLSGVENAMDDIAGVNFPTTYDQTVISNYMLVVVINNV